MPALTHYICVPRYLCNAAVDGGKDLITYTRIPCTAVHSPLKVLLQLVLITQ